MKYEEIFMLPVEWVRDVDESVARTVSDWADQEVISGRLEHKEDHDLLLKPAMQKLFVDIGLQSMVWPESDGGAGIETGDAAFTLVGLLEEVGRADTGIAFLFANTFAVHYTFSIIPHRDEELLSQLAPLYCQGDQPAVAALVLPCYGRGNDESSGGAGFHGLPFQVKARKDDDGWVLSGKSVRPQCSGADAALFGVVAEGEDGGPAFFLVPGDTAGLRRGEQFKKTGLAASRNAELDFEDVLVPDDHLVFTGDERLRALLCCYYLGCSAVCQGGLLTVYEILKEWSETRVIKGKGQVFKENPLVASVLGEVGGLIAAGRILAYNLARILSQVEIYGPRGRPSTFATSTAVLRQIMKSAVLAMNRTMELMGSAGYASEWNLERYWRDIKTIETYVFPETAALADMARHYFGVETL